jgi:23S rRNA (pseudouridine1915-N3)-methyltransferase
MFKIKIISVGKTKEAWLDAALEEYVKRLKPLAALEFIWAKNDDQLVLLVQKEPLVICLDPGGTLHDSEQFAGLLMRKLQEGGSRLCLVIGGPEGLPPDLKQNALLSLSPMTMTHQIVRLVLIEQIYRAFEMAKGSKYHK